MTEPRYMIAHLRGGDPIKLEKLGFTVFYPNLDDYVFLKDVPEHKKFLRKQSELGISFLKKAGKHQMVPASHLKGLESVTKDPLIPGSKIHVVEGYCSNMEGDLLERNGKDIKCKLYGYNSTYEVWLTTTQVVLYEEGNHNE